MITKKQVKDWLDALIGIRKGYDMISRLYDEQDIRCIEGCSTKRVHMTGLVYIAAILGKTIYIHPNWDEEGYWDELVMEYEGYQLFELQEKEKKR